MAFTKNFTYTILALGLFMAMPYAQADNLKDISQLASQPNQQAVALERVNAYIVANPKDVQALFIKGVILAEMNRRDEAIKVFTEITEKSPNLPEPYNNLAVLYADQGKYDKARLALENAIKTHPSYATAHENLGDIYARMASESYDKALQLDSSNSRAQNKLALIKDLFAGTRKPPATVASKPVLPDTKPSKTANLDPEDPANSAAAPKPAASAAPTAGGDDLVEAVQKWAKAWSSKEVDQYLAAYSNSFKPPKGEGRSAWEKSRKERINKPGSISVDLSDINVTMESADTAKVSFKQSYKSANLAQRTKKVLVMKKENGKWLIAQEIADK